MLLVRESRKINELKKKMVDLLRLESVRENGGTFVKDLWGQNIKVLKYIYIYTYIYIYIYI
jgi:hypothetical protein